MSSPLGRAVERVVQNGNCSGCGGCTLVSGDVSMELRGDGWMRPRVQDAGASGREEAQIFKKICPGVVMTRADRGMRRDHATFGSYITSWRAQAADPEVRENGSSAGVLTALSQFLVETGHAETVAAAGANPAAPTRTVPVRIQSRAEALAAGGSRYAPVSVLAGAPSSGPVGAVSGKPCEISAMRRFSELAGGEAQTPFLLSFFCAGTPSQRATNALITKLGVDPSEATSLRYRGNGWPGRFSAESPKSSGSLSYEDSWGKHLGRDLQWRCKICPDGTGEDADVAVGDFWEADELGYPVFEETQGSSVAIARTERGQTLLLAAAEAGYLVLEEVSLDDVARIQPLQVNRKQTLAARLAARVIAGNRIPNYRGYGMVARAIRDPRTSAKAFARTFVKARVRGANQ
ncbi:Coenzyme F420 hydrogenase/dehydrogenase, beta subunit C-terminal domain [Pseudoclavibacter helvolus]|uniref:Coenzyme F420 hydrogenase/dehydrogenase, beta subunit C-terminal domain n=1 Tax=Pseudoclavibacter helvolus TaxID=255205 RepID=UPI003C78DE51